MRNIIWDLTFIYDVLQKHWPIAAIGGVLAVAFGFVFGRISMIITGAIVLFVVIVDLIILLVLRMRGQK